jgi:conjugal transfer pilus assembly protein TraV
MKTTRSLCATAALASLLGATGCSITGLNAGSSYACKAPEGVKCDSVSGTYHNAVANNLPSQRKTSSEPQPDAVRPASGMKEARYESSAQPTTLATMAASLNGASPSMVAAAAPSSLRSGPRILRLWIKPWEDADGDLNGESVVYIQVEGGRWLVDHAQRQIRDAYAPVRTLGPRVPSAAAPDVGKGSRNASADRAPLPVRQVTQALPEAAAAALRTAQQQAQPHDLSEDDN